MSAELQKAFRAINLTFHDLRHEAGSRLLEAGWPLHHVQEMLGHANVSRTSTYLPRDEDRAAGEYAEVRYRAGIGITGETSRTRS